MKYITKLSHIRLCMNMSSSLLKIQICCYEKFSLIRKKNIKSIFVYEKIVFGEEKKLDLFFRLKKKLLKNIKSVFDK